MSPSENIEQIVKGDFYSAHAIDRLPRILSWIVKDPTALPNRNNFENRYCKSSKTT